MNENVLKVLNENLWDIITMSDEPNAAPVAFKTVLEDGRLAVADVFLTKTVENIKANGMVVVSAFNPKTLDGYRLHGKAYYLTEGELVDTLSATVTDRTGGKMKVKGAVVIDIEKVYATTPGTDKNPL